MKRFITSIFICTLLCSCGRLGDSPKDLSRQSGSVGNVTAVASKSPVVTESATAAESPVPTANAGEPSRGKSVYVTDRTGQKCELKMGSVDVENKGGVAFSEIFVTADYAQVVDNHYYFMRSDGKRNYAVYRDKGEKVGAFSLKRGYVEDCALYKKKFYVMIRELPTNKKVSIREGRSLKLGRFDLKSGVREEVFRYNYVDVLGHPTERETWGFGLDMDEDYIYDAHRICRINKKTLKRTLFRDTFVRDIKDGLYAQEDDLEDYDSSEGCDSEDDGDDDEQKSDIPDSCTLNFMDFDAKIVKRIWKGGLYEKE